MEQTLNHGMCRCCASEGMFKNFSATYQWMGADEVYADMLKECFDISLTTADDWNNGGICEVCITQLRNASNFRKQVLQTEDQFKKALQDKLYKDSIVKVEVNRDEDDLDSDNNVSDFSGTGELEFEVPVKEELEETKIKKRTAKATTSRAKKAKTEDGEPSSKRSGDDSTVPTDIKSLKPKIKRETQIGTKNLKAPSAAPDWKITITKKETKESADVPNNKPNSIKLAFKKRERKELDQHLHNIRTILLHTNATPIKNHNGMGYVCGFCPLYYEKPADLKNHTVEAHNDTEKNIFMKDSYLGGYIVRLDITNLRCKICDKDIVGLEQMVDHLQVDHDKKMFTDIKNRIVPFGFDKETLYCCICSNKFDSFNLLRIHMNIHYRNFECEECSTPFITERTLRNHRSISHKKGEFKCSHCDKVYDTRSKMLKHEKAIHIDGKKRIKCPYCEEKLINYMRKREHMEKVHGVEPKDIRCLACNKTFTSKSKLTTHTNRIHLMQRKYKCDACEMRFFKRADLVSHMLKHTGERAYKCDICAKTYVRKPTLREHMRTHETGSAKCRFKCEHCGKAFVYKKSWRKHMRAVHSEIV